MAKKQKDGKKKADPPRARAETPQGGASRDNDMRRIAREAAWARMFGKNSSKNPFGERP